MQLSAKPSVQPAPQSQNKEILHVSNHSSGLQGSQASTTPVTGYQQMHGARQGGLAVISDAGTPGPRNQRCHQIRASSYQAESAPGHPATNPMPQPKVPVLVLLRVDLRQCAHGKGEPSTAPDSQHKHPLLEISEATDAQARQARDLDLSSLQISPRAERVFTATWQFCQCQKMLNQPCSHEARGSTPCSLSPCGFPELQRGAAG